MNNRDFVRYGEMMQGDSDLGKPLVRPAQSRLINWLAKYLALPLTPFAVGASIRMIRAGELTLEAIDPGELSFSMAMFCLFGSVAAQRMRGQQHREAIFAFFALGVALFMSMFSFSVVETARMSSAKDRAIEELEIQVVQKPAQTLSQAELDRISRRTQTKEGRRILNTILFLVSVAAGLFLVAAVTFRERYGLGDD